MSKVMPSDQELDVRGLHCPLPLLRAKKVIHQMGSGEVLHVVSDDDAATQDFIAFSKQTGHQLLHHYEESLLHHFYIKRK